MITGPLFKWFGSKWLSSLRYPKPKHDRVVEPFAGGAGYSLRHFDREVTICESDVHLLSLWRWLIGEATEKEILSIPLNVPVGTDIRSLGLSNGQALLLKNWQRTNNVGNCWTISPWGHLPGMWTENTRSRVAREFKYVRHWTVRPDGMAALRDEKCKATWFIDPPYQFNYAYRQPKPDYSLLAELVARAKGQKIVCEALCQKTKKQPDWLPFRYFDERIASRRKVGDRVYSSEVIYISEDD